jgi:hypothetical protein
MNVPRPVLGRMILAICAGMIGFLLSIPTARAQFGLSCGYRCVTEAGFVRVEDGKTYFLYTCRTNLDGSVLCFYR